MITYRFAPCPPATAPNSGRNFTQPVMFIRQDIVSDNVMCAAHYPFESMSMTQAIEVLPLSHSDMRWLFTQNAQRIFRLSWGQA